MDELSGLVTLLQGVSSPALVILAVFAWNLNKSVKELSGKLGDLTVALGKFEIRLAVIEHELELDAGGGTTRTHQQRR